MQTGERPLQDLSKNTNIKKLFIETGTSQIILPEKFPLLEVLHWISMFESGIGLKRISSFIKSFSFCPWKKDGVVSVNLEGCSALEKAEIELTNKVKYCRQLGIRN